MTQLDRIEAKLNQLLALHHQAPAITSGVTQTGDGHMFIPGSGTTANTNPHANCPPPCDTHGHINHDDGTVTPHACPGPQAKAS